MVEILKRAPSVELGDTGTINAIANVKGDVKFTISEHGIERASLILPKDRTIGLIKALCKMTGVRTTGG